MKHADTSGTSRAVSNKISENLNIPRKPLALWTYATRYFFLYLTSKSVQSGIFVSARVSKFWLFSLRHFMCVCKYRNGGVKKQRTCNKFFFKLNKTAAETHQMLKEAFGEQAFSQARTFEVLVNGWITCTHYGWGKQMCVVSCSTHDFKISWVCLLPHTELQEAFIAGDTSKAQSICLWKLYILKTIIRESIKCDILIVSISVAWYQKYVHIKACLATGCIYIEPAAGPECFIHAPGKVNSGDQNIKEETLEHVPYTTKYLPSNHGSPQKPKCTMWLQIYRKQWKRGSYTWAFLDIEGASDSTSCNITNATK